MKQNKKRSRFTKAERKIITFIICVFLIGGIVGGGIVAVAAACKGTDSSKRSDELYGTRDGRLTAAII